ncbi:hypothetical protein DPEC_G00095050 [Dallia pectoralis]|uniref:Uncharacterized protein n=1 Tax=Dallia pectoralis TaxID=75939 RepID=A0ACC2GVP4_DALPE|nr:hypothetical protein DPEC_G00095050 [Dallia pectoralis]
MVKNTRDSITKPSCLVNRPWKLRTNDTLDIFTEVLCWFAALPEHTIQLRLNMSRKRIKAESDAIEHILSCIDKPILEERFIDSHKALMLQKKTDL